jgi:hypothetical protein
MGACSCPGTLQKTGGTPAEKRTEFYRFGMGFERRFGEEDLPRLLVLGCLSDVFRVSVVVINIPNDWHFTRSLATP